MGEYMDWKLILEILTMFGTIIGLYWKLDKRLALIEQKMNDKFEGVKQSISRLEVKQDKYNNLQERTLRSEMEIKNIKERLK